MYAFSPIKLTDAVLALPFFTRLFSTTLTQLAQVIPEMLNVALISFVGFSFVIFCAIFIT
jgi:hypothetical protein